MESNKSKISRNLTEKKKVDMDWAYVKQTHQQCHKRSSPTEPTRTK